MQKQCMKSVCAFVCVPIMQSVYHVLDAGCNLFVKRETEQGIVKITNVFRKFWKCAIENKPMDVYNENIEFGSASHAFSSMEQKRVSVVVLYDV